MVVKNGSKPRIRKDAGSPAPPIPLPNIHRLRFDMGTLGVMVAMVTTSLSMPIHMRFARWPVTPPPYKTVIEKANHLPSAEVLPGRR